MKANLRSNWRIGKLCDYTTFELLSIKYYHNTYAKIQPKVLKITLLNFELRLEWRKTK